MNIVISKKILSLVNISFIILIFFLMKFSNGIITKEFAPLVLLPMFASLGFLIYFFFYWLKRVISSDRKLVDIVLLILHLPFLLTLGGLLLVGLYIGVVFSGGLPTH